MYSYTVICKRTLNKCIIHIVLWICFLIYAGILNLFSKQFRAHTNYHLFIVPEWWWIFAYCLPAAYDDGGEDVHTCIYTCCISQMNGSSRLTERFSTQQTCNFFQQCVESCVISQPIIAGIVSRSSTVTYTCINLFLLLLYVCRHRPHWNNFFTRDYVKVLSIA